MIDGFIKEKGYPPSTREMGSLFGGISVRAVHDYIVALESKGYISYEKKKPRTIKIIKDYEQEVL